MVELIPVLLFVAVCAVLLLGYPVAFSLAGTSLLFALVGIATGYFDESDLLTMPSRLFGIMENETLMAVPLFIFMGVMLEKSKVAENLLNSMALLFGPIRGGLAISVVVVGALLAASTGIVGATVVTMGLMAMPTMLRRGYDVSLSAGAICATGTLGQIIPPSIALVLLGDVLSSANVVAQTSILGNYNIVPVSVGDLFMGAIVPGFILVLLYILYVVFVAYRHPEKAPAISREELKQELNAPNIRSVLLKGLVPPLFLIVAVLGSIIGGYATPTEAAAVGAFGSTILAILFKQLDCNIMRDVVRKTTIVTSMVFMILIGARVFTMVFRGFGGDELVQEFFQLLPGGVFTATLIVMAVIFLLGFILDFIEITFVVVPIVGPVLLAMGLDPIWLGVMIAINLQTSFLTPPFGFALFYLRGVAPKEVQTSQIYRGVIPFIIMQLALLIILAIWPDLVTWLPNQL